MHSQLTEPAHVARRVLAGIQAALRRDVGFACRLFTVHAYTKSRACSVSQLGFAFRGRSVKEAFGARGIGAYQVVTA